MRRREFLLGASAFTGWSASVGSVQAVTSVQRTFRILRDGSDIGRHVLSARLSDAGFEIDITIDIAVKILGITAYRYELENRELWKDGTILSVESRVNDDGDEAYAVVRRENEGLVVDGSGYSGAVPAEAVTTSYYVRDFHVRRPWVSTQTGKPLKVEVGPLAGRDGWVDVRGELGTKLGYDARGEWVGCEFDAGGEPGRYELLEDTGQIAALWTAA